MTHFRTRGLRRRSALSAAILLPTLFTTVIVAGPAHAVTVQFGCDQRSHTIVFPAGVTNAIVRLVGAAGGAGGQSHYQGLGGGGGRGSDFTANINVTPGLPYGVTAGCRGGNGTTAGPGAGGYNGGGSGGTGVNKRLSDGRLDYTNGGGGGGRSEFDLLGSTLTPLLAAGGGGGGGANSGNTSCVGGIGGASATAQPPVGHDGGDPQPTGSGTCSPNHMGGQGGGVNASVVALGGAAQNCSPAVGYGLPGLPGTVALGGAGGSPLPSPYDQRDGQGFPPAAGGGGGGGYVGGGGGGSTGCLSTPGFVVAAPASGGGGGSDLFGGPGFFVISINPPNPGNGVVSVSYN